MSAFRAASDAAMRQAWLWRHRTTFSTTRAGRLPHLLVDVSGLVRKDAKTGIQRVVRAIWSQLSELGGSHFDVVPVYATKSQGYCYAPLDFFSKRATLGSEPVLVRSGDNFLGLDLSAHLLPKYRTQLCAWRSRGATISVVIYDLLPLRRPDWFNPRTCRNFERWYRTVTECADRALCISDQVADEVAKMTKSIRTDGELAI